jgi:tetratricopeptide (TPR) repeat protein
MRKIFFMSLAVSLFWVTFAGPPSVLAEKPPSITAEQWYGVAMDNMKKGEFLAAAEAFQKAYNLAGDATLLYNAARSYEKAGRHHKETNKPWRKHLEKAKQLYLTFTIQDGVKKKRKEQAIERVQAVDTSLSEAPSDLVKPRPHSLDRIDIARTNDAANAWHWVTLGSGAVLALGAVIMAGVASSERDTLTSKLQLNDAGLTSGVSQFDAMDIRDSANTLDTAALISGIASAALLTTGITLLLLDDDSEGLSLIPTQDGLLVSAGGRF